MRTRKRMSVCSAKSNGQVIRRETKVSVSQRIVQLTKELSLSKEELNDIKLRTLFQLHY